MPYDVCPKKGLNLFVHLLDLFGAELLLSELVDALSGDELQEYMSFIARNWDIEVREYDAE